MTNIHPMAIAKSIWHKFPTDTQRRIRRAFPIQTQHRLGELIGSRAKVKDLGLISIVVPMYNVEPYIRDCLNSLSRQSYTNLEIIVVDDGSEDHSVKIARQMAKRDSRISVFEFEHRGNGFVRNFGIEQAKGRYLTFCDSDDMIPNTAYHDMLTVLSKTESDFIMGKYCRLQSGRRFNYKLVDQLHAQPLLGINIDTMPELLRDAQILNNKIYRTEFWRTSVGPIPEGVQYEDNVPVMKAYLRAKSFDIFSGVVYDWRIRDNSTSTTQRKHELANLQDRVEAAQRLLGLIDEEAGQQVTDTWFATVLGEVMWHYIQISPQADIKYWETLRSAISQINSLASVESHELMTIHQRVVTELVVTNQRDVLESVLNNLHRHGNSVRIFEENTILYCQPDYYPLVKSIVSAKNFIVHSSDLKLKTRVYSAALNSEDKFEFTASVYVEGVSMAKPLGNLEVSLQSTTGPQIRIPLDIIRIEMPEIDEYAQDAVNTYSHSAFRATISQYCLKNIITSTGKHLDNIRNFRVVCSLELEGHLFEEPLQNRDPIYVSRFGSPRIIEDHLPSWDWSAIDGLTLALKPVSFSCNQVAVSDRNVRLQLIGLRSSNLVAIKIVRDFDSKTISVSIPMDTDNAEIQLALPEIPEQVELQRNLHWSLFAVTDSGQKMALPYSLGSAHLSASTIDWGAIRPTITSDGTLGIDDQRWRAVVDEVNIDSSAQRVTVNGYAGPWSSQRLALFSNSHIIHSSSLTYDADNSKFSASFELVSQNGVTSNTTMKPGSFSLRCASVEDQDFTYSHWLRHTQAVMNSLPKEETGPRQRVIVNSAVSNPVVVVHVRPPFKQHERGKYNQRRLQEEAFGNTDRRIVNTAVFESFVGKNTSDSPGALYDGIKSAVPSLSPFWSIRDYSVDLNIQSNSLLMYSAEWYEALSTSRLLVNNCNFPSFFTKAPGQIYVQTWHGTPLKKIVRDAPVGTTSNSYLDLMKNESEAWDVFLSQSETADSNLRTAFRYSGISLIGGYPRNDLLSRTESTAVRERLRSNYRISDNQKIVLYAPTWRDNKKTKSGNHKLVSFIDYDKIYQEFGDSVTILLRGHHTTLDSGRSPKHVNVIDVTEYPDITELYCAADALITDYSSVMFDFAVSQKPIYILAPDIVEYEDSVRGFYFDLRSEGPSNVLTSTLELINSFTESLWSNIPISTRQREFAEKFASLDDGYSADRVWQHVRSLLEESSN